MCEHEAPCGETRLKVVSRKGKVKFDLEGFRLSHRYYAFISVEAFAPPKNKVATVATERGGDRAATKFGYIQAMGGHYNGSHHVFSPNNEMLGGRLDAQWFEPGTEVVITGSEKPLDFKSLRVLAATQ